MTASFILSLPGTIAGALQLSNVDHVHVTAKQLGIVSDNNHGALDGVPLNRSNDDVSRCGIKRAGGFVEDQCTGWRHKGPCKCNALALTTRKVSATFANVREYAIWQLPINKSQPLSTKAERIS